MKPKTERQKQRAKEWRRENPDKVAAQQERRKLRAEGLLAPYVRPPKKTDEQIKAEQIARMKAFHERRQVKLAANHEYAATYRAKAREADKIRYLKRKADPEAHAAWLAYKRERNRIRRRIKLGIPLDAPLHTHRLSEEEKARRAADKQARKSEREALRLSKLAAKQAAKPPKPVKPKISEEERREQRLAKRREYNKRQYEADRLKRASKRIPPAVCPDPPELQALFKKAAKGEPVRPIAHNVKKRSVFHLRGYC